MGILTGNFKYKEQPRSAELVKEQLLDVDAVSRVSIRQQTTKLPDNAVKWGTVVDAVYLQVEVNNHRYQVDELIETLSEDLDGIAQVKREEPDTFEIHYSYCLEGGSDYYPFLEDSDG